MQFITDWAESFLGWGPKMMLKLVDTSQKYIILGIFILDKVTCLRALLDPPPPQDGVAEFTSRYPLRWSGSSWEAWSKVKMHKCCWRRHDLLDPAHADGLVETRGSRTFRRIILIRNPIFRETPAWLFITPPNTTKWVFEKSGIMQTTVRLTTYVAGIAVSHSATQHPFDNGYAVRNKTVLNLRLASMFSVWQGGGTILMELRSWCVQEWPQKMAQLWSYAYRKTRKYRWTPILPEYRNLW